MSKVQGKNVILYSYGGTALTYIGITFTNGGNPFITGVNDGTIAGTIGSTVRVKLWITGGGALENATGTIDGNSVLAISYQPMQIVDVVIPPAGFVNFSINKSAGSAVVNMGIVPPTYLPWACATSVSFNTNTEFIETSVSGSGKFATYLPTRTTFTGSMDGIVAFDESGMLTLPDLRAKQLAQELILIRYIRTDDAGNTYTDEANFYISSSSDSGSYDGMNTFSIELQGSGPLIITTTP